MRSFYLAAPKNFSDNLGNLEVSSLPTGYYYLKLTDEHFNSATKGFIIAR